MARRENWRWDWAGTHGTLWGTCNGLLTIVTTAVVLHLAVTHQVLPSAVAAFVPFGGGIVAVVGIFARAAMGAEQQDPKTTFYKAACWAGSALWCTFVVARVIWPGRWIASAIGILVIGAVLAGVIAWIADGVPTPKERLAPVDLSADKAWRRQAMLGRVADQWTARIKRVAGIDVTILSVEPWTNRNGYTVEGEVGDGGHTWKTIASHEEAFGGDLNLADGCRTNVAGGVSRRRFLVDVMTRNALAEDHDYPSRRTPHSINDDLEVAVTDDGRPAGPNLRQNAAAIAGETGSGKTNASHCYTAEIATSVDGLEWRWDLTGKSWSAWMDLWLRGDVDVPPIDWCEDTPQGVWFMARAGRRIATARNVAYRRLMLDADDDKIPVSREIPQIIISGDEVAPITGATTLYPHIRAELQDLTFESRAGGVRPIFYPLRGTDDVFISSIQSQCHVRGCMRVQSPSEAGWILQTGASFGPEDTPYPGCGGLRPGSGKPVIKIKYYRMTPAKIKELVRMTQNRRPELDEISRLAANGRHPDGTPMDGLEPGELDYYDSRWGRFLGRFGYPDGRVAPAPVKTPATPATEPSAAAPIVGTPQEEVAKLHKVFADLDEKVARVKAQDNGEISPEEDAKFNAMMEAEGFGKDWTAEPVEETPEEVGHQGILLDIIRDAGGTGIAPKAMLPRLGERGIHISRDTLYRWLNQLKADGRVSNPRQGRWFAA